MEQSGSPGVVHMTADSALRLHKEGPPAAPPPPLHLTTIKSKGAVFTAWCAFAPRLRSPAHLAWRRAAGCGRRPLSLSAQPRCPLIRCVDLRPF